LLLLKHPTFREELQKALEGEKRGEMAGIRPCRERLGEWCDLLKFFCLSALCPLISWRAVWRAV
jgi:hypothetical protein